jgi:hypothetical protein
MHGGSRAGAQQKGVVSHGMYACACWCAAVEDKIHIDTSDTLPARKGLRIRISLLWQCCLCSMLPVVDIALAL